MSHQLSTDALKSRRAKSELIRKAAKRGDRTCIELQAFETELRLANPGLLFLMGSGRDFTDECGEDDDANWDDAE